MIFLSINAFASEVADACATYKNTGKQYKIKAHIYKGSELNKKTNSSNYDFFSTYVLIFWSDNKASKIELDMFFEHYLLWGMMVKIKKATLGI